MHQTKTFVDIFRIFYALVILFQKCIFQNFSTLTLEGLISLLSFFMSTKQN